MIYPFVKFLAQIIMRVKFRMKVCGAENIPENGAVVLCSNHLNFFDPLSVAVSMKRPVHFMSKAELFKNPVIGAFLRGVNAFPVNRDKADINSFKTALGLLKNGDILGIFVQGHRMAEGDVSSAKSGAAMFACKAGAPVLPVYIKTEYKTFGDVKVTFGKPLTFPMETKKVKREELEAATETIISAINALSE